MTRSEREESWQQVEQVLTSSARDGVIRARQVGTPRNQTTVIPWPAAESVPGAEVVDAVPQINGLTVKMVTLSDPPKKANSGCAKVILQVLYETQKRHTGLDLVAVIERDNRFYPWSQSVIENSCLWLRRLGAISNGRDELRYWLRTGPLGYKPVSGMTCLFRRGLLLAESSPACGSLQFVPERVR